jgi:3-oxoacyl-[acyl-carrier-protein] synthase-3
MALFATSNVRVTGISAAVPVKTESNRDYDWISESDRNMLIRTTGIETRHIANPETCTSDLSIPAVEKLLEAKKWDKSEIDLLVLVTQSNDYFLPATAVLIQNRVGLPKTCAAFDIGLGCSGYVYGLSVVMSMMQTGGFRKGLFVAGDVSTTTLSYQDKSTWPLFGDAVTVTALEYAPGAPPTYFNLQSDGAGYEAIIVPDGCLRQRPIPESFVMHEIEPGIIRNRMQLSLNGLDVFNFSAREAPDNARKLMEHTGVDMSTVDYFVMHQANMLMNETIRKKLKIDATKTPYSLKEYGNTSSASIPITMVTQCAEAAKQPKRWLLSGFGVGLSWGSCLLDTEQITCPPVVLY